MSIVHSVEARARDLGGFAIRRLLPVAAQRQVGPFTFFDHFGPARLEPGKVMDVGPHPHIGLATVTYLLEGELVHRDSLGITQVIRPGEINWMNAGRGIVHSERSTDRVRSEGGNIHGLQLWVALPHEHEESEPSFEHHPHASIPEVQLAGARVRVLAGTGFGASSAVRTLSPLAYFDIELEAGASLELDATHPERAIYPLSGILQVGDQPAPIGSLHVLAAGSVELRATSASRLVALAGPPLDGPRLLDWNFVSSSAERIAEARSKWALRDQGRASLRFPLVPGDDDYVSLPGKRA